jgi:hypothetical protein
VERVLGHEDSVDGKLATIAGQHERGEVLPGFAYRDESVFDLEIERLFQREWVSIICAQSVPEPGNVFPVMIAGQSLLVVRDKDGDVQPLPTSRRGTRRQGVQAEGRSTRLPPSRLELLPEGRVSPGAVPLSQ